MLSIVLIFNAAALTFAIIAFRAPKTRKFDVETARRIAMGENPTPMSLSSYEPDAEVTAMYMSWVKDHKCEAARIRVAA